jgi:hypothetical protein
MKVANNVRAPIAVPDDAYSQHFFVIVIAWDRRGGSARYCRHFVHLGVRIEEELADFASGKAHQQLEKDSGETWIEILVSKRRHRKKLPLAFAKES